MHPSQPLAPYRASREAGGAKRGPQPLQPGLHNGLEPVHFIRIASGVKLGHERAVGCEHNWAINLGAWEDQSTTNTYSQSPPAPPHLGGPLRQQARAQGARHPAKLRVV